MRAARETFSLRSLKVRIALAGAMLILASVTLTVIFVLREVGRSSEQIVLDSQEDDARRIAATVSQRLVGLQRALRGAALQLTPAALGDTPRLTEFFQNQGVGVSVRVRRFRSRRGGNRRRNIRGGNCRRIR